jgi:hypothetical protein
MNFRPRVKQESTEPTPKPGAMPMNQKELEEAVVKILAQGPATSPEIREKLFPDGGDKSQKTRARYRIDMLLGKLRSRGVVERTFKGLKAAWELTEKGRKEA